MHACGSAYVINTHTGSYVDVEWRDVKVGQVLKVLDNELFPADLLCLHSSLEENVCFIKTTNLVRCVYVDCNAVWLLLCDALLVCMMTAG